LNNGTAVDIWDKIAFFFFAIKDYIEFQFETRDAMNWILFFFPLVIFVEVPRYFLPAVALPLLKFMGLLKDRRNEYRQFLETKPFVSIIVAGRNESQIIPGTIESLLNVNYSNMEIIIVDDCSDDNMYEVCKPYADKGLIRLFRNNAISGRAGRPVASNLGLRMSRGQFIISVDADTSYDNDIIERMIGPFVNPSVGAVAGNLKVRNLGESLWTDLQAVEYAISIGLWKRWTSITRTTMQASGAFGAFRREALTDFGGWDPELAEDADISLKVKKCGWQIAFSPYAIAMTNVPSKLMPLVKQRVRWDKGTVRTYFHKHIDLLKFWKFPWRDCFELILDYVMVYISPFIYLAYVVIMIFYDWKILLFALALSYIVYVAITFFSMLTAIAFSERRSEEWFLLWYSPIFPVYKEIFRWVRLYANFQETFRIDYEESYIPKSGYKDSPKW
jgi:cellulose synthase/poly-beta-1,6-N-acetylglucosamine synthase-like glycosyltransferase